MTSFLSKITAWFKPQPPRKRTSSPKLKLNSEIKQKLKKPYSFNSKYHCRLINKLVKETISSQRYRNEAKINNQINHLKNQISQLKRDIEVFYQLVNKSFKGQKASSPWTLNPELETLLKALDQLKNPPRSQVGSTDCAFRGFRKETKHE